MLHAYRLAYPDSPHAPERLWEWEKVHVGRLLWNATACGRELTHRYFPTWEALVQERLDEYRELVRDMQDMYEEHHGRKHNDRRPTREAEEQIKHTR